MKFRVTFKDPDAVTDACEDAAMSKARTLNEATGNILTEEEVENIADRRSKEAYKAVSQWVEYGEYITVEFDTNAGTAVVVSRENNRY